MEFWKTTLSETYFRFKALLYAKTDRTVKHKQNVAVIFLIRICTVFVDSAVSVEFHFLLLAAASTFCSFRPIDSDQSAFGSDHTGTTPILSFP